MTNNLKVMLAQLNFTVGDIHGNLDKHLTALQQAREHQVDLLIFSELSLTGYPPEDLLLRPYFIQETMTALQHFISKVKDVYCIVGHLLATENGLLNACSLIFNGQVITQYAKQCLPNYGVFDEDRYFISGNQTCVIPIKNINVGLTICEDMWCHEPINKTVAAGAKIIVSINASPFEINKQEARLQLLTTTAKNLSCPIIYVNQIGGQDELIFDGGSMILNTLGEVTHSASFFKEDLLIADLNSHVKISTPKLSLNEKIYSALTLGVHDYVYKNHFERIVLGLSGGIDSALTLAIAVDAIGSKKAHVLILPSRYTAKMSIDDAVTLADNLNVSYEIISIEPVYQQFLNSLKNTFQHKKIDLTEENIQARCRAIFLMAYANKFNALLLTTGNRSEMAVGYATLYGDMAGALAVIKDVPKTMVYELANYRNQLNSIIPSRIIDRAPSAELAPDQKDEDSLPPYSMLDPILHCYLNLNQSIDQIVAQGFDAAIVKKIVNLIHKSEYKRRQSAIGIRINHTAFGRDRRYPITSGFKG